MKEATGELNMTVIVIVAIAAVAAFFYAFIWPAIQTRIKAGQVCSNPPKTEIGTAGQDGYVQCTDVSSGKYTCTYYDQQSGGNKSTTCTQN